MIKIKDSIKESKIFVANEFTYEEYVSNLVKLQEIICKFAFKENYHEAFRMEDAVSEFRKKAIIYNLDKTDEFYQGNKALKLIAKELAISFSGKKAENHVDNILQKYITRNDFTSYRGIYLDNGIENTEIDNLILTKNGFLLLEVKNIKSDVQISEEGRLYVDGDCSYEQIPLAEKMERKRRLFKEEIKKALKEKGVHIDIELQSRIVFNEPMNSKFYINNFSEEKWCKSSQISYIVNNLYSKFPYSEEQLRVLKECCEEFEVHQKNFSINYDIEETLNNICILIDLIEMKESEKLSNKKHKKEEPKKVLFENLKTLFNPLSLLNPELSLATLTLITTTLAANTLSRK